MLPIIIRGLLARRARLALTVMSVVLAVASIVGTLIFTDSFKRGLDRGNDTTYEADLSVTAAPAADSHEGDLVLADVPADLRNRLAEVDGVQEVSGFVGGDAYLLGSDGEPVDVPSSVGLSLTGSAQLNSGVELREGRLPTGPDEVAVDHLRAAEADLRPGDRVQVLLPSGPRTFTLTGTVGAAGDVSGQMLANIAVLGFDLAAAQELFGSAEGSYHAFRITAEPAVDQDALRARVAVAIGDGYEVTSADATRNERREQEGRGAGQIQQILLVFAGIAVLVSVFVIANTFSVLLAQRTRELALLRCVGASRAQLVRAMLVEGLLIGAVASLLGLAVGPLLAIGLETLVERASGLAVPDASLRLPLRTVLIAFAVGMPVTMMAAVLPAIRAARIAPIAALQLELAPPRPRQHVIRLIGGSLVGAVGGLLLTIGLRMDGNASTLVAGAGIVLGFLGVHLLLPLLIRPVSRVLGWPLERLLGITGQLAWQNAARSPKRAAATAAALMIGVLLVTSISTMMVSLVGQETRDLDAALTADYVVQNQFTTVPEELTDTVIALPETGVVVPVVEDALPVGGAVRQVQAVPAGTYQQVLTPTTTAGDLTNLTGGMAVATHVARDQNLQVGDQVAVDLLAGARQVPVRAVFEPFSGLGDVILDEAVYQEGGGAEPASQVFVIADAGVRDGALETALDRARTPFPGTRVQSRDEVLNAEVDGAVDQAVALLSALLGMAVLIGVLGVANTLALSVLERVRELGMLRAIGLKTGQVRMMVQAEAVVMTLVGTTLGVLLGIGISWAVLHVGEVPLQVSVRHLGVIAAAAAGAGMLVGIGPARQAARVDMLRAVSST